MKKLLSLLLVMSVVLMCFGSVSLIAFADNTVEYNGVTYTKISTSDDFTNLITANPGGDFAIVTDEVSVTSPVASFSGTLIGLDISFGTPVEAMRTITVNINSDSAVGLFVSVSGGAHIKNIRVTGTINDTGKTDTYTAGFVGTSNSGTNTFENCENATIINNQSTYVGGILAYSNGGTVNFINCKNTSDLEFGTNYVGGIVASAKGLNITKCSNTGNIQAFRYAGGLVASNASTKGNISILTSWNLGNVNITATSKEANVGGIIGKVDYNVTIKDCYNMGTVTKNNYGNCGDIFGVNSSSAEGYTVNVQNCYSISKTDNTLINVTGNKGTCSISNCYYLSETTGAETNGITPLLEDDMKNHTKFTGFDFENTWVMTSNYDDNSKYYLFPQIRGNIYYPEAPETPEEPEPEPEPELGTQENPYKITTPEEFTSLISDNKGTGKYFRLENNISLGDKSAGISYSPIEFIGNFDGNGKTITVYINADNLTGYGVFSTVVDSTISNLIVAGEINVTQPVENPQASDNIFVGAIVSLADKTTISNCTNNAVITANGDRIYSGGIVGRRSTGALTISNCNNNGNIESYYAGGISGFLDAGNTTIDGCKNYGKISGNYVGGLVGRGKNTTIKNSYNYGAINGTAITGGIVAEVNTKLTVDDIYNYGTVQSEGNYPGKVGGIAGANTSTGATFIFENVYNLGAVLFEGEYVDQQILGSAVVLNDASSLANVNYLAYDSSYDDERDNTTLKTKEELSSLDLSKFYLVTNNVADNGIYSSENKKYYAYEGSIINYTADGDEDYTIIEASVNSVPATVTDGAFSFTVIGDTLVSVTFTIPEHAVTEPVKFETDLSLSDSLLTEEVVEEIANATRGALFFSKFTVRESDLEYGFAFSKDNVVDENDTLKAASKPEAVAVFYGNNDTENYHMASYIKDKDGNYTFFNVSEFTLNVNFTE